MRLAKLRWQSCSEHTCCRLSPAAAARARVIAASLKGVLNAVGASRPAPLRWFERPRRRAGVSARDAASKHKLPRKASQRQQQQMIMLALLTKFLAREAELVVINARGQAGEAVPRPRKGRLLVFPGSFDPLHEGHTKLAEAALDATKQRDAEEPSLLYEISSKNADKGVIDVKQAEERLLQFKKANAAVALTRRALYVEKSQLFGPCDFVMGADTASRVLDAKYYGGVEGLAEALDTLRERGCGFVVAGRLGEQSLWMPTARWPRRRTATACVPRSRTSARVLPRRLERARVSVPYFRVAGCCVWLASAASRRRRRRRRWACSRSRARAALIDEEPSQADQRAGVPGVHGGALDIASGRHHELEILVHRPSAVGERSTKKGGGGRELEVS